MPNKWENKVLKRKEHKRYHQNSGGNQSWGPMPGKYAMGGIPSLLYTIPKKYQTIISGMKKRNETFMDCHDIFA